MNKGQRRREIEKIWEKHATGMRNYIAVFMPHANQKAFFDDLNQFMEDNPVYPEGLTEEKIAEIVAETIKENNG